MRRNHDRHGMHEDRMDTVYVEWPELWGVRRVIARPMKTIYINRDADPETAQDREFASVNALEHFCEKWSIELP